LRLKVEKLKGSDDNHQLDSAAMDRSEPDFEKTGGLIPAIVQDADTGEVLMMAYMNAEAFAETLKTRTAVYFSRSRQKLWRKGEQSGHVQRIREIRVDCDQDTLLLKVDQVGGAACHTGYKSCFYRVLDDTGWTITHEKVFDPQKVYK
jgi:phosphoribosyl-AMP cyclohydrolase